MSRDMTEPTKNQGSAALAGPAGEPREPVGVRAEVRAVWTDYEYDATESRPLDEADEAAQEHAREPDAWGVYIAPLDDETRPQVHLCDLPTRALAVAMLAALGVLSNVATGEEEIDEWQAEAGEALYALRQAAS